RPQRVHRWWTEDQVAQFRSAFQGDAPRVLRDRAMAELGLMGLRVSEVIRLDIERLVHLSDPERAAIVVLRKGNKEQVLPLTADQQMATVGLGIEEAQRLLGHANPATTQVYYEVTDQRLRNAARRLRYGGRVPKAAPPAPAVPPSLSPGPRPPRRKPLAAR